MSKKLRELYHYLILAFVLTSSTFLTFYLTTLTPFMDLINGTSTFLKIISWISLFFIYFISELAFLFPTDWTLHKLFKI